VNTNFNLSQKLQAAHEFRQLSLRSLFVREVESDGRTLLLAPLPKQYCTDGIPFDEATEQRYLLVLLPHIRSLEVGELPRTRDDALSCVTQRQR
jgi:hypothetical protein